MDQKIRQAQENVLKMFSAHPGSFALAGGTALELYYLHHRFSADLDFFSPKYDLGEIDKLISVFKKRTKKRFKMESEFISASTAKVRFYTIPVAGSDRPLKIDFVEDVLFEKPNIKRMSGVPVYSAENIYLQKIIAVTGVRVEKDETGRQVMEGRREARDVFDIYMLSKKIVPLHLFLKKVPGQAQRGMVHWYRTFSRQELKLALLDLDIYDKKFDSKEMLIYLEGEMRMFIREMLE